jgi:membrane protease YdiL (CAAX protease family)
MPLRTLLGSFEFSFRSIAIDIGIAIVFWVASLIMLAAGWTRAAAIFMHWQPMATADEPLSPGSSQKQSLRALMQLDPANDAEILAWLGLCMLAGFAEEAAFRGYLQRQFIAGTRGRIAPGVTLSEHCFGAAHKCEGARGMFLIFASGAFECACTLQTKPACLNHCARMGGYSRRISASRF